MLSTTAIFEPKKFADADRLIGCPGSGSTDGKKTLEDGMVDVPTAGATANNGASAQEVTV